MNSRTERLLRAGLAGLLLVVAGARAAPQEGAELAEQRVQRRASLRIERERLLVEAWERFDADGRARLERALLAELDPRRGRFEGVPLQGLSRALRLVQHPGDDGPLEAWFDLVDSVDLRVVPGVFAAREEGRGEPMTVTLEGLWDSEIEHRDSEDVEVALIWIGPDGVEVVARQEPAGVRALESGFEMYVRPPASEAAVWSLVLEVRTRDGVVRSQGVDVECVAELARVRAGLLEPPAGADPAALSALRGRLDALQGAGLRVAGGATLASWIAALQGGARQGFELVPERDLGDALLPAHWRLTASAEAPDVLVLLATPREHPADLVTGPRGEAWAELAREEGWRVVVAPAPESALDLSGLRAFVRALKAGGAESVVLVARGDVGRVLPGALAAEPLAELDGLVLSETPAAFARLRADYSTPTLRIESGVEADAFEELGVDGGPRRTRAASTAPPPLAAQLAPRLVARWLGER